MNNTRINHLNELNHSDYKIADGEPQIENWKIVNSAGDKIGKVNDLLFDKEDMKVRYIVTDVKDGDLISDDRRLLIPIGQARMNTNDHRVEIASISRDQLNSLPAYSSADEMTKQDECVIRNTFAGPGPLTTADAYDRKNFYNHDIFNEDKFYNKDSQSKGSDGKIEVIEESIEVGKKDINTGGKRISSRLVERSVEEKVRLKEEDVHVNRKSVDRPASNADVNKFKSQTIEKRETAEVPVVNKEARVVEEVSLEKDVKMKDEVVKDTVHKTKVEVENLSKDERLKREREEKSKR